MTDRSAATITTIPTELGRADPYFDLFVLGCAGLVTWYAYNMGAVWLAVPVLLVVAACVLTGEPAGDVQIIGGVAAGLRSKLGLRRAHEWVMAFAHYFRVRIYPDWMITWQQSRLNLKRLTLTHSPRWLRITSVIRNNRLRHWYTRRWSHVGRRQTSRLLPVADHDL